MLPCGNPTPCYGQPWPWLHHFAPHLLRGVSRHVAAQVSGTAGSNQGEGHSSEHPHGHGWAAVGSRWIKGGFWTMGNPRSKWRMMSDNEESMVFFHSLGRDFPRKKP